jgi:hypothetical protein
MTRRANVNSEEGLSCLQSATYVGNSPPVSLPMVNGLTVSTMRCVPVPGYAFVFGGCEMIDFTIKTLPCHFIPRSNIKRNTWPCFAVLSH